MTNESQPYKCAKCGAIGTDIVAIGEGKCHPVDCPSAEKHHTGWESDLMLQLINYKNGLCGSGSVFIVVEEALAAKDEEWQEKIKKAFRSPHDCDDAYTCCIHTVDDGEWTWKEHIKDLLAEKE